MIEIRKKMFNKKMVIIILGIIFLASSLALPVMAKAKKGERMMSRAEVAVRLSATEFMKKKIAALFDFAVGYDFTRVSRTSLAPIIRHLKVAPTKVPPDGRTILALLVEVDDPGGLKNIRGVRADMSNIGRPANMLLVDNGLWGDEKSNDGVYTLQVSVNPRAETGKKEIPVAVTNKDGWLTVGKTDIVVKGIPIVSEAKAEPLYVAAGRKVKLSMKVSSYGKPEPIERVLIDLSSLGGTPGALMFDDGTHGDEVAEDSIYTLETEVGKDVSPGEKILAISVTNVFGDSSLGILRLIVTK